MADKKIYRGAAAVKYFAKEVAAYKYSKNIRG